MESPVPYGADHINSNPLLADGSDFPCKQRDNVYKLIKQNIMPVGQNQTLSFRGQATHGGGTCQISLTTDKQPTKNSVWKVINTIEGGCPSTNPGNIGDDPTGYGADKFQFAIPQIVPSGDYTLAWTWFNKIGNREMYMNCAPITVTGSSTKHKHRRHGAATRARSSIRRRASAMASLPNMFVANIGNGCSTAESGTVLAMPQQNLGSIVQHIGSDKLTPPVGSCAQGQAAVPAPARPDAGSASTSVAPSVAVLPSAVVPTPSSTPAVIHTPAAVSAQPQTSAISPVIPQAPAPSIPAGTVSGSCSTPGKSLCLPDGTGIGTCDETMHVVFAPAPLGTKCDQALGVLVSA
ncbi:MAG: hypothetical protein Q9220_003215 [cf. Caloplaca sp. 1 TL-2023]